MGDIIARVGSNESNIKEITNKGQGSVNKIVATLNERHFEEHLNILLDFRFDLTLDWQRLAMIFTNPLYEKPLNLPALQVIIQLFFVFYFHSL